MRQHAIRYRARAINPSAKHSSAVRGVVAHDRAANEGAGAGAAAAARGVPDELAVDQRGSIRPAASRICRQIARQHTIGGGPAENSSARRIVAGSTLTIGQCETREHRVVSHVNATRSIGQGRAHAGDTVANDRCDGRTIDAAQRHAVGERDAIRAGVEPPPTSGGINPIGHQNQIAVH